MLNHHMQTLSNFTAEITRSNFEIDEKNVLRLGLQDRSLK